MYSGIVVVILVVVEIPRPREYFQCGIHLDGEVLERAAEKVDVELVRRVVAGAHRNLVEIGQMLVDCPDIVLVREIVADALHQFCLVVSVVEQHGIAFPPVSSCTSRFLEIGFQRIRTVHVDD